MRVAVTGASGFVGGCVARTLAARGHDVFSYGRRSADALLAPLPRYTQWDVADAPLAVPEIDAVVHCAAHVGDWGLDDVYVRVNVQGTRHVLTSFARAERFVHVSTASVYSANHQGAPHQEAERVGLSQPTAYGRSKAEAERVVSATRPDATILRPHVVYGPGDTTLLPRVLGARRFGWLIVPGDGRNRLSITHVLNLVHAVECALKAPDAAGIFNVADGEEPTLDALLREVLAQNGVRPRIAYIPRQAAMAIAEASERAYRAVGAQRAPRLTRYIVEQLADENRLDTEKAKATLHYKPEYSLRRETRG